MADFLGFSDKFFRALSIEKFRISLSFSNQSKYNHFQSVVTADFLGFSGKFFLDRKISNLFRIKVNIIISKL